MSKNFDDFMKTLDAKDWSLVVDSISARMDGKSQQEALMIANLHITTTLLKEYHNWLNSEKEF